MHHYIPYYATLASDANDATFAAFEKFAHVLLALVMFGWCQLKMIVYSRSPSREQPGSLTSPERNLQVSAGNARASASCRLSLIAANFPDQSC